MPDFVALADEILEAQELAERKRLQAIHKAELQQQYAEKEQVRIAKEQPIK